MFKTLKKIWDRRKIKKVSEYEVAITNRRMKTVPNLYIRTIDGDKLIKINQDIDDE